jgi:hypothetical protein
MKNLSADEYNSHFYEISKDIIVKVSFSHVFVVEETWNLLGPMVFSHSCNLLCVLSVNNLLLWLTWLRVVFLVLFHILDVSFNLVFKCLKRVHVGLGVDGNALGFVRFFHKNLHLSDVVIKPRWRWLLQVDPQVLEASSIEFHIELN